MGFKSCVMCGTRPVDADAPHELPSPKGYEPMRFCDSCMDVTVRASEYRTSQGASDQIILREIWLCYGLPAHKARMG